MGVYGLAAKLLAKSVPLAATAEGAAVITAGVGVLNVLDTLSMLHRIGSFLHRVGSDSGDDLAEEMVRLMRERGPDDTGRLEAGTVWQRLDGLIEVKASAIRQLVHGGESEDYAAFVEFGTDHSEAEPFFWDTAREVLAAYGREIARGLDQAMSDN
jgi:Bacteriophage HK97-gp10, putative tail-component